MNDTCIKEFRHIQIDMLKQFISICNDNQLRYYLLGGSCLGAVRHAGFIPWDDDIDVGMPREDFERFSAIAKEQLPEHLFFQTNTSDPEYINVFAKLRNSNTTYIETSAKNLNINHGVYIDIFPLDGISNNHFYHKIDKATVRFYNVIISQNYISSIATPKEKVLK